MKVMIINGPNLNLLGERPEACYPRKTLEEINAELSAWAEKNQVELKFFQGNSEGEIINSIHEARNWADLLVINPGAFTHYSYAIRDAISGVGIPAVEVHLSQIYAREDFRKTSVVSPVCKASISGFAEQSYLLALIGGKSLLAD